MNWHTRNGIEQRRWRRVRRQVLNRDRWRCTACGKAGRLEVHHCIPLRNGGAKYDLGNLVTVCRGCHFSETAEDNRREPTPDETAWRRLVSDLMEGTQHDIAAKTPN